MCGINGFTWPDVSLINHMNFITRYRGPDDSGVYVDNRISLGTVRLAIIDLSEDGHQPMTNEERNLWITYNGEVYNFQTIRKELTALGHRFNSQTDTEVVLRAYETYGLDSFNRFNGMWGVGLYDKREERLILCRDRYGVKPLYYSLCDQGLIFSSMITAILAHSPQRQPNDLAIMQFLAYNLEQHDAYTFFEGVHSLLPGHMLSYDLRTQKHFIERWYTPKLRGIADTASLRERFLESVQLRTIADVPIGVCLSGGIDSSAITCALNSHLGTTFRTYSLVSPGTKVDETKFIEEVCRHTRAEPFYTTVKEDIFLEDISDFITAMEEPVNGLSAYAQYIVFKLAHEQQAKVLLDGQGGDELLAGYIYYYGYFFYELFSRYKWVSLSREMISSSQKFCDTFPHAMFLFLLMPDRIRYRIWKKLITPWINHEVLEHVCGNSGDPRWNRMGVRENLTRTLFHTSIPHNLMWEDKSSMRWSVESRVPFMDVNFVETALSLKTEQLLGQGETKRIFKNAIADMLPDLIRNRTDKIGFAVPEDEFFRQAKIVDFAKSILYSDEFKQRPYWHWPTVEKIFLNHVAGKSNAGQSIWKWINLELWFQAFMKV